MIVNNYVTETPSNIRKGLGYKDRPPHEKSEECKRFECELDAELDEIDDSREKLEDDVVHECAQPGFGPEFGEIMAWLDRQAAITEREFWECYANGNQWEARQYEARCMELTAERDALADDLLTCNKEREEYRELFSEALTLAAEIVNLQP